MNEKTEKIMAIVGMTNTKTMDISKGVAFVGSIITAVGIGGMMLSRKYFTEDEMEYLMTHLKMK